ncbi:MAG: hypothetical protein K2X66_18955 [Cyanobacteria bacterium]|nr:hypothetical protein [Cyanobacteriota bacterium]
MISFVRPLGLSLPQMNMRTHTSMRSQASQITKGDQVHFSSTAKQEPASPLAKLLFVVAEKTYKKEMKWNRIELADLGDIGEDGPMSDSAIKTKLADGRTLVLAGSFLDIEGGDPAFVAIKDKGRGKKYSFSEAKSDAEFEAVTLFNQAWMFNYSYLSGPARDEDEEEQFQDLGRQFESLRKNYA